MEDLRLDVVRVLPGECLHGLLVVLGTRILVDLIVILEELPYGRQPIALTVGSCADRVSLLHRIEAPFQGRGIERADKRIGTLTDRDAPIRDRAIGVRLRNGVERFDGFRKEEGVQHGESALKLLLRLGRARGLKLNAPESIRVGDWIMLLCKGRASESGCRAEA